MAKLPVKAPEGFVLDEPNVPEGFVLDEPIIAPETADPQSIQGVRDTSLDKYVDEMISTAGQAGISLEEADRIGKLGLFEDVKGGIGFWEAAKQDWKTKIPFSPAGAVETLNILSTASRLHRDDFDYNEYADTMATYPYSVYWKPLTAEQYEERDIKTITNYMEKMAERELRGYTGMGKFGAAISVVPAWMIEFAATGGLKKLGSEPAKKFLAKRLRSRLAGRLGGWVAGAAVRTTLGMPHRTVEATLRRRLTGDPENWATSISLGWGEVFIEALSEEAGGAMVKGAKGAGVGLVSKLPFGKKFIGALQVAWMDKTKGTAAQFAKRVFTKGGYHGIVGEIGEERLATLLHGLVGTEEFGAGQEAGPLARVIAGFKQDWENKYVELGVFGTIGGGQLALGKAAGLVAPKDVSRLEEIVTRFNEQIEAAEKRGDTEMVESLRLQEALEIEGVVAPAGEVPELPEVKGDELEVPEEAAPEIPPTVAEKIRAAAYYNPNTGEVSEGPTHPQAAAKMKEFFPTIEEGKPPPEGMIEGFVTESGKFVTNKEAEAIAKKSGQIKEGRELTQEERILGRPTAQRILAAPTPAKPTIKEPSPEELDRLISAREDQILLEQGSDELLRVQHRASEEQLTDLEYLHRLRSIKLKGEAKAPAEAIKPAEAVTEGKAELIAERKRLYKQVAEATKKERPALEAREEEVIESLNQLLLEEFDPEAGKLSMSWQTSKSEIKVPGYLRTVPKPSEIGGGLRIAMPSAREAGMWQVSTVSVDTVLGKVRPVTHAEFDTKDGALKYLENVHKNEVRWAVQKGKPVPRNVLKEYKGEKWADEALAAPTPAKPEGLLERDLYTLKEGEEAVTKEERTALQEQGYTVAEIARLSPSEAKGLLAGEVVSAEPVTPVEAKPLEHPLAQGKTHQEIANMPIKEYADTIHNPADNRLQEIEQKLGELRAEGGDYAKTDEWKQLKKEQGQLIRLTGGSGLPQAGMTMHERAAEAESVTPITKAEPVKEDWQKAIETSLTAAKKLKPIVAEEKTTELGKRVGKMAATMTGLRKKGVRPEQAIAKSTAALRGELTEYDLRFEPIRDKLSDEVIDSAFDSILESKRLRPLDKENTRKALSKLLDGSYLRLFESDLITDHFGMDMGKEARRRVPFGDSWTRTLAEYIGIPRTSLTALSGDMSGIMRQARPLGQVYPKEFADFVVKSVKAWGSEKAFRKMEEESLALPFVDEAATDGVLEGTRYGEAVGEPMERGEEFIGAGPLEKIPIIKYPIKAAERAFTVLNIFRRAVYSRIRTEATRTGVDTMSVADRKRIASIINDMSGRAHIKRTKAAKAILPYLQALFAPRFRIARVRAPFRMPIEAARFGRRLVTGERLNLPELRMTAGAFASTIATNLLIMYLVRSAYLAWGGDPDDVEMESDLRATDGGKLRIKDMHIDLWMGYLQDFQTYMQLATGQAKSQAGELYDINRVDVLKRAIRKRTRPFVSLAVDALTGETVTGKRFGAPPKGKEGKVLESWEVPEWLQGAGLETWNRIVPLVTQDAVDALIIEGVPESITMGVLSHFGISVATYEKWAASELKVFKNQLAMQKHGKKWDKLRPDQQEKFAPQLVQLELLARQERPLRPRSKFVSKEEEAQKERMFRAMSPPVKKILEDAGMDVGGISRFNILGLDKLDDKRFEFYEKRAIKHLEIELKQLSRKKGWSRRPIPDRVDEIKKASNKAKEKARRDLDKEILRGNI